MRRLWILSLVFLAAVSCAAAAAAAAVAVAAAEEKAPIECYFSFGDTLGPTKKCKDHCILQSGEDGRITARFCDFETDMYCLKTLPLTVNKICKCEGSLCNSLVPPDFKCYSGAEGDCDYLSASNAVLTGSMYNSFPIMPSRSPVMPVEGRCPGLENKPDAKDGRCFKTTYSFQSKSCTVYGCKAEAPTGGEWTLTTSADGNTRTGNRTYDVYDDSPSATFVEVQCTGSSCHKPAKTCGVGGLTLSLVGLMAAVMAAYST